MCVCGEGVRFFYVCEVGVLNICLWWWLFFCAFLGWGGIKFDNDVGW